jgi:rhodanese-related sulfurtransferase
MPQQAALKSKSVVDLSIQVPSLKFTTIDLNSLIQMINREEVAIVDVRDDDYVGGHIIGSEHVSFDRFESRVHELVDKWIRKQKKSIIVFTCMHCEQRGPACAGIFANCLEKEGIKNIQIHVLSGGFQEWLKNFAGKSEQDKYIEDFDPSQWIKDTFGNYLHVLDSQFLEFAHGRSQQKVQ